MTAPATAPRAFTLLELLVVVAIIALLTAILLPSLHTARRHARTAKCLANVRGMQLAHWMYMTANDGQFIQAGLSHGGHSLDASRGWIATLQSYYANTLLHRCVEDNSPYWGPGGQTVNGVHRTTSYGINNYLDRDFSEHLGPRYSKLTQVRAPSSVVHFVEMTREGRTSPDFAVADHPHVDLWVSNPPVNAANQLQIDQHGGPPAAWTSKANYGFLDGHAETLTFREVFRSQKDNQFDPGLRR